MTPWVTRILYANVALFFLTRVFPNIETQLMFIPMFALIRPWTLVTYMFLHAGFGHIFFNMLALYFFGPRLESRLGGRPFLTLYFVSGLMGAILSIPLTPRVAIVGASGAVFGVLLGFAKYWPKDRIYIWGILPIEARTLVIVMTVFSLYAGFGGAGGGVAHFAHLGGFLGGFLYLKWWERRSPAGQFRSQAQTPAKRGVRPDQAEVKKWSRISREDLHPVNREELDRVLDKINESGVSSLSSEERDFLERFAAK